MTRTCILIVFVLDSVQPLIHKWIIEAKLKGAVFGLNINKPDIDIKISHKGCGLMRNRTINIDLRKTDKNINIIAKEYKLNITFRDKCDVDDLIGSIEENRVYIQALYAINKVVKITIEELDLLDHIPNYSFISTHLKWKSDELLERMRI